MSRKKTVTVSELAHYFKDMKFYNGILCGSQNREIVIDSPIAIKVEHHDHEGNVVNSFEALRLSIRVQGGMSGGNTEYCGTYSRAGYFIILEKVQSEAKAAVHFSDYVDGKSVSVCQINASIIFHVSERSTFSISFSSSNIYFQECLGQWRFNKDLVD